MFRDVLDVWPDIGSVPPDAPPFPRVCPRTLTVLATWQGRWLQWVGGRWEIADPAPEVTGQPLVPPGHPWHSWAGRVGHTASHTDRRLAAHVLLPGGGWPAGLSGDMIDERLEATGLGDWLGVVGKRMDAEGTCTGVTRIGVDERGSDRYRADMVAGPCRLVWWTGENCWVRPGEPWRGRLTVVAHRTFDGYKVTTVSRLMKPKTPSPEAA